jgi:hypothetical protein
MRHERRERSAIGIWRAAPRFGELLALLTARARRIGVGDWRTHQSDQQRDSAAEVS